MKPPAPEVRAVLAVSGGVVRRRGHRNAMMPNVRMAATTVALCAALAGCTSPSTTTADPVPTPSPSSGATRSVSLTPSPLPPGSLSPSPTVARKLTPPRVTKGEVSRLVFPGRGGSVEADVRAEVIGKSYELEAACTARTPGRTLTFSLLNATSKGSLTPAERFILSSGVECNGQPTVIRWNAGFLPRTIIQIEVGGTQGITSLYAVLRAAGQQ